jgi:hypothetical protein
MFDTGEEGRGREGNVFQNPCGGGIVYVDRVSMSGHFLLRGF